MRTLLLAALLLAVPVAASAGPSLALRVGWEAATGEASGGTPVSDVVQSVLPVIQVDAHWRFGDHLSVGPYAAYGFGRLSGSNADRCDALGADCSVRTARVGLEGRYGFPEVSQRFEPWVGAGIGYEWARDEVVSGGGDVVKTVSGWEWFVLEAGADVKIAPKLSLGPYVTYRTGEYARLSGFALVNQAIHHWVGIGIRGRWDP